MFIEWLIFVMLDFFWDNGENAAKLLRSLILLVFLIAIGNIYWLGGGHVMSNYGHALWQAPEILLGITKTQGFRG